ncbi:MAG: response regulator [Candidatus Omnitrophica bacterium]|nr:response regulator [Candidatus Omnitrophota bacterium]
MKKNILIIDDEGLITKTLQKLLKSQGYSATVATNGQDAVEKSKTIALDLIVCDIRMPQLDGIETIKKIRQVLKDAGKPPVKEILITGYADEESYKNAMELKVADYLLKPFDTKDFLDVIKRNIESDELKK